MNPAWLKCPEPSYISRKETLMAEFGKQSSYDITGTSTMPGTWGVVDSDTQHQRVPNHCLQKNKNWKQIITVSNFVLFVFSGPFGPH